MMSFFHIGYIRTVHQTKVNTIITESTFKKFGFQEKKSVNFHCVCVPYCGFLFTCLRTFTAEWIAIKCQKLGENEIFYFCWIKLSFWFNLVSDWLYAYECLFKKKINLFYYSSHIMKSVWQNFKFFLGNQTSKITTTPQNNTKILNMRIGLRIHCCLFSHLFWFSLIETNRVWFICFLLLFFFTYKHVSHTNAAFFPLFVRSICIRITMYI